MKFLRYLIPASLLIGTLAAIIALPQVVAHAAPAKLPAPVLDPVPTGVWNAVMHSQVPSADVPEHEVVQFSPDGQYVQSDRFDGPGLGAWEQTGPQTFEVIFVRQLFDSRGSYLGYLHIHLNEGFVSTTHYVGQGEIVRYGATGRIVGFPELVHEEAFFVSQTDPNWIG